MDAEKRKISTDALETLGKIIDEKEKRDAIHLAVIPIKAKQKLYPGQHVGADGTVNNPVGIVDPFLDSPVFEDQFFWLVIYPRKITSLRHVWSHPAFPDNETLDLKIESCDRKRLSKEWIEEYASTVGYGYGFDTLMAYASDYIKALREGEYGQYLIGGEEMQDEYVSEEFWKHYEIVTGDVLSESEKESNFFGCSC